MLAGKYSCIYDFLTTSRTDAMGWLRIDFVLRGVLAVVKEKDSMS